MGLDSFWMQDNERASVPGEFRICGGMLSGHGNDSFRGKVYNDIIESLTGVSLYQEKIPNETVKQMSDKLDCHVWNRFIGEQFDISEDSFNDLLLMFRLHSQAGHDLVGWW